MAVAERCPVRSARLLLLALLCLGLAAPSAPAAPGVMDRIAELFTRGHRVNVQLAFDADCGDHDWCMNSTVARLVDERDERGERVITITTNDWLVNGTKHAFTAFVRDGKLERFELQDEVAGAWTKAPAGAFRFDVSEKVAPSFDEEDQAVLSAWGLCNEGRGSTNRMRATVVVRSFTVEDAPDLSY
jgi:hypothetical protein